MKKIKIPDLLICIFLVIGTLGFDQITKYAVMNTLEEFDSIELISNFFYLTYVKNTAAGFSLFADAGMTFFITFTCIALIFILYYFFSSDDFRVQVSLALIFSGALGNMIDRIQFGYVRDFFSFYIFGKPFPVFNIADSCIVIGIFVIIAVGLYDDYKEKKKWKS